MFGIKFRSWMETHIVRPRKKQQQQQQRCKEGSGSKGKPGGKVVPERPLLDSAGNSPTSPLIAKKDEPQKTQHALRCGLVYPDNHCTAGGASSCNKAMETIALPPHHHHHRYMGNNLSSPESAYSTGYSTDGTSPGASFPPEYYINIRTGTHYFHSAATTPSAPCNPVALPAHRHLANGHVREDASRDVRNGCVVEVEILSASGEALEGRRIKNASKPKALPAPEPCRAHPHSHRRTESCDESRRYPAAIRTSFAQLDDAPPPPAGSGISLDISYIPSNVINSSASPQSIIQLTASPRQRNRIRTNPWLPSSTPSNSSAIGTSSSASSSGFRTRAVQAAMGESSTNLSSCSSGAGCKHAQIRPGESSSSYGSGSDVTLPRKQPSQPRPLTKHDDLTTEENARSLCLRGWCQTPPGDSNAPGGDSSSKHHRGSVCSSSSSSSCHTANNYCHSNTSDPSDDDLTLNEMLGKYDESYVYEKETDILSDSDPTDCEEDYGETDFDTGQDGGDERDPQDDEDFDFIDNGSYLELNPLDLDEGTDKSTCPAKGLVNKGHCTYHVPHSGAEFVRKPTARFRESFIRRSSSRRHSVKDEIATGSPGPSARRASIRKFNNEEALSRRSSRDGSRHRRHHESITEANGTAIGNPSSRPPSEKKKMRCSMRRSCSIRGAPNKSVPPALKNNGVTFNSKEKISIVEAENSGVYNLNRILMQKMLFRVNGNGTRSAGNTPVSLRKRMVRDDATEVRKTILSPSRIKRCVEDNKVNLTENWNPNSNDLQTSPSMVDGLMKKRSYSVSCGTRSHEFRRSIPASTYLTTFSSEIALIEADKEADRKYKELILEAEHILVSMKGNSEKCLNFCLPPPPPPPPIITTGTCRGLTGNSVKQNVIEVTETKEKRALEKSGENGNNIGMKSTVVSNACNSPKRFSDEKRSRARNGNEQDAQQNASHSGSYNEGKRQREAGRRGSGSAPGLVRASSSSSTDTEGSVTPKRSPVQQRPPLVTFRSIDLGHELGGPGYCPQSEPVKRKVYTCSATFDRLQKTLEKSQHQPSLRNKAGTEKSCSDKGVSEGDSLREKLDRLRRERLEVEAKVREAQEEERQRLDDKAQCQRQLSLFRRQMLVHTIEGLKRSLEDQSAKLQETYSHREQEPSSDEESLCRRHSANSSNKSRCHKSKQDLAD